MSKRKLDFGKMSKNNETMSKIEGRKMLAPNGTPYVYKSNKPKKSRHFGTKLVTVLLSCSLLFAASPLACKIAERMDNAAAVNQAEVNLEDYVMETDLGAYIKLPVDENPISIVLGELEEDDRKSVIGAINELDNISSNIDYKILETDDVSITNKIYISDAETNSSSHALGVTELSYNAFTGTIEYPVYITVDTDACESYISDVTGEDAVSAVIKHELGHSLGFKDLYNIKPDESIMYYNIYTENYTPDDAARIRAYYGGKAENVDHKYDQYLNPTEPESNPTEGLSVPACLENKADELMLVHKDEFAEVWEHKNIVFKFEKEKDAELSNTNQAINTPANLLPNAMNVDERKMKASLLANETLEKANKKDASTLSIEDEMGM